MKNSSFELFSSSVQQIMWPVFIAAVVIFIVVRELAGIFIRRSLEDCL